MAKVPASQRPLVSHLKRTAVAGAARRMAFGSMALAAFMVAPAAVYAQAPLKTFDIAAAPLATVLNALASATGSKFSFAPELVAGLQSNGVKGSYTVDGALHVVLAGSGLSAARQADGSYLLSKAAEAANTSQAALPAVTVSAASDSGLPSAYAGGQVARGGSLGVLGTADVMDTPFSTTNYTSQLIADQQAMTLGDVVENTSSVRMQEASGGFGDTFSIRGYTVSANDVGLNGLYGMAAAGTMPTAIMERVEVLSGPGTLMSGMGPSGSIGGTINIVTKRAGDEPLTRVTTTYESKGRLGTEVDVARRFGEDNAWGVRVNGQYLDGEGGVANSNQKQSMGALALDYTGKKLRWYVDAYYQARDVQNTMSQVSLDSSATALPSAPSGHSPIYEGNNATLRDAVATTRLEYDLSDNLMAYGAYGYHQGASNQTFPIGSVDSRGNVSYYNYYYDAYSITTSADVGLRARFNTWGIGHTVNAGVTQMVQESGYFFDGGDTGTSNIYSASPLVAISAARGAATKTGDTRLTSFSLADTVSIADGRVLVTGGVRKQQIMQNGYDTTGAMTSSYNSGTYSPMLGIVYKLLSSTSLYANYSSGLSAGAVVGAGYTNSGQALTPYKSKQYETGVKVDWGRVTTSAALFQISKPSTLDVTNADGSKTETTDGDQRNRGLELSAYGEAARGVRLMASATFYDAKLYHTTDGTNDGNTANGVPRHTFNLGGEWDTPWLQGLTLNARAVYTSSLYYNASNTVTVPSWIRYDLGARYSTKISGKSVVFRANIQNLFNKNYWLATNENGYVSAGSARALLLSAQVDF